MYAFVPNRPLGLETNVKVDKDTKQKGLFLKEETGLDVYLAILPCHRRESPGNAESIVVDLYDDGNPTVQGFFEICRKRELRQTEFGDHSPYSCLVNNRCDPNCVLEGWRLDKGGEYRVLVKSNPVEALYNEDNLSANFGNNAIPCECKKCSPVVTTEQHSLTTAEGTAGPPSGDVIPAVMASSPLKKRALEGLILLQYIISSLLLFI